MRKLVETKSNWFVIIGQNLLISKYHMVLKIESNLWLLPKWSLNTPMKLKPTKWASQLHWPNKRWNSDAFHICGYLWTFHWKLGWKTAFPLTYIETDFTEILQNAEFIELPAGCKCLKVTELWWFPSNGCTLVSETELRLIQSMYFK